MPKRFGLEYIAQDGTKKTPVMIHRAFMGSIERFMAMLIEHYAGAFPLWLAPEQIWILPVSDAFVDYAETVQKSLRKENKDLRIHIRNENETLGKKIREGEIMKIPYLLIVGEKEKSKNEVSVRERGKGDMGSTKIEHFNRQIQKEL